MKTLVDLIIALGFASLWGFIVGRAGKSRHWSAKKIQWTSMGGFLLIGAVIYATIQLWAPAEWQAKADKVIVGALGAGFSIAWLVAAKTAGVDWQEAAAQRERPSDA